MGRYKGRNLIFVDCIHHRVIVLLYSPSEPNRHSINCYPKENARQKPRNLKKLEDDRQMSLKKGGRAQFTVNKKFHCAIHDCAITKYHLFISR
jgi:hypothetical protein